MKKIISILIAVSAVIALLSSCSEKPSNTATEAADTATGSDTAENVTTDDVTEPETEPDTEPETEPEFNVVNDPDATLTVPRTFGSHMVLQRDSVINVFGYSNRDGAVVRGTLGDSTAFSTVVDGKFELHFKPRPASSDPVTLLIEDDRGNSVSFDDVLIGDVWIIGGQSNAQVQLSFIRAGLSSVPEFDENDGVRLLMQSADYYVAHPDSVKEPLTDLGDPSCHWKRQNKAAASEFSALGLFFARHLYKENGVPVGMICTAANGAQIQELMSKEAAYKCKLKSSLKVGPGGFFNGMMNPLIGISFKGLVFFQGESESIMSSTSSKFDEYVKAYTDDLRDRTGIDFPLFMVQLSSYTKASLSNFPYVYETRTKQLEASETIANCTLITSYDLGSPVGYSDPLHSPRKQELGERIADAVLAVVYGKGDTDAVLPPVPVSYTKTDDGKAYDVKFEHVGGGLVSLGENGVAGFAFGNKSKKTAAEATVISPDTVRVTIPENVKTSYISYGYENVLTEENAGLYSGTGIPAAAFNTKIN